MKNYTKQLLLLGSENVAKGIITVTFRTYSISPFKSLMDTGSSNQKLSVEISALINNQPFSKQIIPDYVPTGENNSEKSLLKIIDETEYSMLKQMSWLSNGGEKFFDKKMSERGFIVS